MGLIFVGALFATIPAGRLTDRVPAGRMLGACLLAQVVALVIVVLAPGSAVFYLGAALAGLAMGAGDPSTNVLVAINVSRRHRGSLDGAETRPALRSAACSAHCSCQASPRPPTGVSPSSSRSSSCALVGVGGLLVGGVPAPRPTQRAARRTRSRQFAPLSTYGFFMAGIQLSSLGLLAVYLVDRVDLSARLAGWGDRRDACGRHDRAHCLGNHV